MEPDSVNAAPTRTQVLLTARVVWGATLGSQIAVGASLPVLWRAVSAVPEIAAPLTWITIVGTIMLLPVAFVLRTQIYKRHWQDQAITPKGYLIGNIVFFAVCESVGLFGLVITVLNGSAWPTLISTVAAVLVQGVNFPHGRPMSPTPNPYQAGKAS